MSSVEHQQQDQQSQGGPPSQQQHAPPHPPSNNYAHQSYESLDQQDYGQVESSDLLDPQPDRNPDHHQYASQRRDGDIDAYDMQKQSDRDYDKSLDELVHEDNRGRKGQYGQSSRRHTGYHSGKPQSDEHLPYPNTKTKKDSYSQQYADGKMIGNQVFYQDDLEEYQNSMRGRRVFLSNLNWDTNWKQLKDHMRQAGDVIRVDIFNNDSGRSKGCGVVEFKTQQGCQRALQDLNEVELDGRKLFLKLDTNLHPLPKTIDSSANQNMQRRDGGNYHQDRNAQRMSDRPPQQNPRYQAREYNQGHHQQYHSSQNKGERAGYRQRSRSRDRSPPHHYQGQQSLQHHQSEPSRMQRGGFSRSGDQQRSPQLNHHQSQPPQAMHARNEPPRQDRPERPERQERQERPERPEMRDRQPRSNPEHAPPMGQKQGQAAQPQHELVIQTRDDRSAREKQPGFTIRCDNLPENVDSLLLKKAFKDFGRIEYCRVIENDYGESKGYGFVEFENKESAQSAAKRMDRAKFNGREVRVTIR